MIKIFNINSKEGNNMGWNIEEKPFHALWCRGIDKDRYISFNKKSKELSGLDELTIRTVDGKMLITEPRKGRDDLAMALTYTVANDEEKIVNVSMQKCVDVLSIQRSKDLKSISLVIRMDLHHHKPISIYTLDGNKGNIYTFRFMENEENKNIELVAEHVKSFAADDKFKDKVNQEIRLNILKKERQVVIVTNKKNTFYESLAERLDGILVGYGDNIFKYEDYDMIFCHNNMKVVKQALSFIADNISLSSKLYIYDKNKLNLL